MPMSPWIRVALAAGCLLAAPISAQEPPHEEPALPAPETVSPVADTVVDPVVEPAPTEPPAAAVSNENTAPPEPPPAPAETPAAAEAPAPTETPAAESEPAATGPSVPTTTAEPATEPPAEPPTDGAEAAPVSPEQPCRDWAPLDEKMIDGTRRYLHERLCSTSMWLDGLFGDRRNVEAARGVHGRVETSAAYSEYYGEKFRTRLDVRVNLPNLEERVSAFLGRDDEDQFVRDRSEGFALRTEFPRIEDQDAWLAGLGYSLPGSKRFKADFRVGVRNVRHPRAFAQTRLRYIAYADRNDLVHARLTPFWNTRDGFGITPGVDYSHVLSRTRLLRWSNIGTISERSEDFDWRSALILYQALGGERGIAFESFLRGGLKEDVSVREYGLRTIYRQPLVRHKLYGELVGGYSWPKSGPGISRDGSYLVGISLEMPFGKTEKKEP